jgi:eukaryotic-like serine/threonine-protein kinase
MAEAPVRVGDVVSGRYRIDRVIGSGSMGFVVAAWHLELDQPVAMKLLNPEVFELQEASQRFRREIRATARIKSEHVARVLDVGTLEGSVPFMVMELLDGNNLEEELNRRGALPFDEAVSYLLEAVEALAEAHAAGIVHRDLKPANLFIARRADRSRLLKVLDFGISKSMFDSRVPGDMSLTGAGVIIGSPLYMSPEQMRSTKDADYRSDIWSLGAILFQLLTGSPPYPGDTVTEICAKIYSEELPPPSTLVFGLPEGMDEVVLRALARNPDDRYQTVAEFGAALLDFSPTSRVHVERAQRVLMAVRGPAPTSDWPRPQAGVGPAAPTIEASVSTLPAGSPGLRQRVVRWGLVATLVAAMVGLGAYGARRSQREPEAVPSAPPIAAPAPAQSIPLAPERVVLAETAAPAAAEAPPAALSAAPAASSARVSAPRPAPRPKRRQVASSEPAGNVSDFGGRH